MFQALNVVHLNPLSKFAIVPQLLKVFELAITSLQQMLSLQLENTNGQFTPSPQVK
jgi:hypothetical protein